MHSVHRRQTNERRELFFYVGLIALPIPFQYSFQFSFFFSARFFAASMSSAIILRKASWDIKHFFIQFLFSNRSCALWLYASFDRALGLPYKRRGRKEFQSNELSLGDNWTWTLEIALIRLLQPVSYYRVMSYH